MTFELTFIDGRAEIIAGVDTYEQEGPMTTFFHSEGRRYVDSWSSRVASFRTIDVARVRRLDVPEHVAYGCMESAKRFGLKIAFFLVDGSDDVNDSTEAVESFLGVGTFGLNA